MTKVIMFWHLHNIPIPHKRGNISELVSIHDAAKNPHTNPAAACHAMAKWAPTRTCAHTSYNTFALIGSTSRADFHLQIGTHMDTYILDNLY